VGCNRRGNRCSSSQTASRPGSSPFALDRKGDDDKALVPESGGEDTTEHTHSRLDESEWDVEEDSLPSVESEAFDNEWAASRESAFRSILRFKWHVQGVGDSGADTKSISH
jgi:hypothetical protein